MSHSHTDHTTSTNYRDLQSSPFDQYVGSSNVLYPRNTQDHLEYSLSFLSEFVDAMHNLFLGLVQEHFNILGIQSKKTNSKPTWSIIIDIPKESINKLEVNECKSLDRIINILETSIKKELKLGAGYSRYFKRLLSSHRAAFELLCTSVDIPLKVNAEHIKKTKFHKPDFVHSILAWVSINAFSNTDPMLIFCVATHPNWDPPKFYQRCNFYHWGGGWTSVWHWKHDYSSWLTSVPTNLGEAKHGKLKADQWRTLGTTYLPISLIWMWYQVEDSTDQRFIQCRKLLEAMLSLISAVVIASSQMISQEKTDLYLHHMQSYLKGLCELFPRYRFLPNQHMVLHLAEYLQLYGPVHLWWTFPFECLIGMLQRIPNNFQNGKLWVFLSELRSFSLQVNLKKQYQPHLQSLPTFELLCLKMGVLRRSRTVAVISLN